MSNVVRSLFARVKITQIDYMDGWMDGWITYIIFGA